jgi:zinc-binding alcohol dehydrogenase/oxidoreductase
MRTWMLRTSPGVYEVGDVDVPPPGPGEVRVDLVASALNHMDLWLLAGLPRPRRLPMVPGCDGAGTISELGAGVTEWRVGDDVVINPSLACGHCSQCLADRSVFCPQWGIMGELYWGAHGASVVVGQANVVRRPANLSWEVAASYGLCGLTAYRMLRRSRLQAGEVLLVVGAAGGVGSAAVALGARFGAHVYATTRRPEKLARITQLGAEGAFSSEERLPLRADVVVDNNGAATWAASLKALKPGGRLVTCGGTAGAKVEVNLPQLFFGQFEVIGSTMGTFAEFEALTELVASGLPVALDRTYAVDAYPEALARLEAGEQFGKIVLVH